MSKAISRKIEAGIQVSKLEDIAMLVKFRLSLMVVVSSCLAYLVAAGGSASWLTLGLLFSGGMATTAAANAVNQVLEKEFDAVMERTKLRPVANARMKSSEAVLISGLMLVFGTICLGLINPLAAFLGMSSFMLYAFVYTPLKRYSTLSVAVGAIPGALPVLIGTVAFDGSFTALGLTLFLVQFLWQFPHFWAISFLAFEDYDKANYKVLPKSSDGSIDRNIGAYSALYAILIIPTIIIAQSFGLSISILSMSAIVLITLYYTYKGVQLQLRHNRESARALMFSSFFYLPIVLIFFLIG